jgi:hypothetical protein
MRVIALSLFLLLSVSTASAEPCDQFNTYPNHPGTGPTYKGVSRMPAPGPSGVVQWSCFFKNTAKIESVVGVLIDPKGKPAAVVQYSADFNYTYYPDQTVIKLSYQKLPTTLRKKMKRANYSLEYAITFVGTAQPTLPAQAIPGTAGCYNRVCVAASAAGKLHYIDMNTNESIGQGPVPGAKPPVALTCGVKASPEETCTVIDATGQMWRGPIRPPQQWKASHKVGNEAQGPFTIGCDINTRYCLVVARDGTVWKGPLSDEGPFVTAGKLPW